MPQLKTKIMDADGVRRALVRIAHEIVEKNNGVEDVCLVGIRRRGVPIAEALGANIEKIEGRAVPVGSLDITFYRDDLTKIADMPQLQKSALPFSIERKRVVLVDDVLYTGQPAGPQGQGRARGDRGAVRAGAAGVYSAGDSGRSRPPRAADSRGFRGQEYSYLAQRDGRREPAAVRRGDEREVVRAGGMKRKKPHRDVRAA